MSGFPENICTELKTSFVRYLGDYQVIYRPLRHTDPAKSLGIFVAEWTPEDPSIQIGPQFEPELSHYAYRVQLLFKATDEEEARLQYGVDAKKVRAILYRDTDLQVRLRALNEVLLNTRETFKRMRIQRQRFLSNEIRGSMMYLATTDLWVETQSTNQ